MQVGFWRCELDHIKLNKMKSITFWKTFIYLTIHMAFIGKWNFLGPNFQNTLYCLQNPLQLTQTEGITEQVTCEIWSSLRWRVAVFVQSAGAIKTTLIQL
jgi:hypothetical protein